MEVERSRWFRIDRSLYRPRHQVGVGGKLGHMLCRLLRRAVVVDAIATSRRYLRLDGYGPDDHASIIAMSCVSPHACEHWTKWEGGAI